MVNKLLAAAAAIGFLVAVRPDPAPSAFGYGVTAIVMYEGINYCIGRIRKERKSKRNTVSKNERVDPRDIERWWNTRLNWPMREVL